MVTLRERELCAIAALAGAHASPVLVGHLRGARRAGATAAEVAAVVALTARVWGADAAAEADAALYAADRARYLL